MINLEKYLFYSGISLFLLAIGTCIYSTFSYELPGPTSPSGLIVIARVSDHQKVSRAIGLGWGADFYVDIEIKNKSGKIVSQWKDPDGQLMEGGPEKLVATMKWSAYPEKESLSFYTYNGNSILLIIPISKAQP